MLNKEIICYGIGKVVYVEQIRSTKYETGKIL